MQKIVCWLLFGFFVAAGPAFAQEIYVHGGATSRTDSSNGSYAWGLTYLHGLGDYAALSLTYLNEGHVPDHKRDGLSPQVWGRYPLFDRKVSLAAGVGPYLYFDTMKASDGSSYSNTHGVGAMLSLSATLYTESRLLFQARGNWIWTPQNANTYVTTLGIGYQLEQTAKGDTPQVPSRSTSQPLNNEVTLSAGMTTLNEWGGNASSGAGSLEYRRSLGRYIDVTAGWLLEGGPISRNGPTTQIWAGRRFFDERLSLGVGAGPYLGFDTSAGNSVTKVNWLVSASASYAFHDHWAIRATWSRVTTDYDRDSDVFLSGISYRF
jgi:hypothetical protein